MSAAREQLGLPAGSKVGRYRLEKIHAAWGFYLTYLAEDTADGRAVAVHELVLEEMVVRAADGTLRGTSAEAQENLAWASARFAREGRALAACAHPALQKVREVIEANGTACWVTPRDEPRTLKSWLQDAGRAPTEGELRALFAPLLGALEHAHAAALHHLNLKPDAIQITAAGQPVLTHFAGARQAIARRCHEAAAVTDGYSAPEQYDLEKNADARADIYGLAAVLHRALTGSAPPDAAQRAVRDAYEPLAARCAGRYGASFLAAVDAALALDPAARPQSVLAWRKMLGLTAGEGWRGFVRQYPRRFAAGAAVAVLVLWLAFRPSPDEQHKEKDKQEEKQETKDEAKTEEKKEQEEEKKKAEEQQREKERMAAEKAAAEKAAKEKLAKDDAERLAQEAAKAVAKAEAAKRAAEEAARQAQMEKDAAKKIAAERAAAQKSAEAKAAAESAAREKAGAEKTAAEKSVAAAGSREDAARAIADLKTLQAQFAAEQAAAEKAAAETAAKQANAAATTAGAAVPLGVVPEAKAMQARAAAAAQRAAAAQQAAQRLAQEKAAAEKLVEQAAAETAAVRNAKASPSGGAAKGGGPDPNRDKYEHTEATENSTFAGNRSAGEIMGVWETTAKDAQGQPERKLTVYGDGRYLISDNAGWEDRGDIYANIGFFQMRSDTSGNIILSKFKLRTLAEMNTTGALGPREWKRTGVAPSEDAKKPAKK